MTDAPFAGGSRPNRPMWRSPWLLAFVVGAITITFLRDCTRRIPDAPVAIGAVPKWTGTDIAGHPISAADLAGKVYILAFSASTCSATESQIPDAAGPQASCGVAVEAAEQLAATFEKKRADASLVLLDVGVDWSSALDLATTLAALDNRTITTPFDLGFVLVDTQGQCRGFYGLHEEGQDEVLHRSQHVIRDAAQPTQAVAPVSEQPRVCARIDTSAPMAHCNPGLVRHDVSPHDSNRGYMAMSTRVFRPQHLLCMPLVGVLNLRQAYR